MYFMFESFQKQIPLLHHYHPAIALHARQLLSSQGLTASADLSQNTLSHFLDRFVYKNPKKLKAGENANESVTAKAKGASAMQPAASGLDGTGVKLMKGEVLGGDGTLVNEDGFLKKKVEDIPADQVDFVPPDIHVMASLTGLMCSFSTIDSLRGRRRRRGQKLPRHDSGRVTVNMTKTKTRLKERT